MFRKATLLVLLTTACARPAFRPTEVRHTETPVTVAKAPADLPPPRPPRPTQAVPGVDVAPVPSGMELLYSDRVPILPSGEPMIAVGIASSRSTLGLRGRTAMT